MNHRLLLFGFLCGLLVTASTMFGMENPQTISIFYTKDQHNNYWFLDQEGLFYSYRLEKLPHLSSATDYSNVSLYYNHTTQIYSLIKDKETLGNGALNESLMNTLITLNDLTLYAQLNNKKRVHIGNILSTRSDSNPLEAIVEEYKKNNNIDIIEREDLNKKSSLIPTIVKSLATLALVYAIIKYIHHLPQLCNKILHGHYCHTGTIANCSQTAQ